MRYPIDLAGTSDVPKLELEITWSGALQVYAAGKPAVRVGCLGRNKPFAVQATDGPTLYIYARPGFLGLTQPTVSTDEDGYIGVKVGPPTPWWAWLFLVGPLLLVLGGFLGIAFGFAAAGVNAAIIRSSWPVTAKIAAASGVSLLAALVWLTIVAIVMAPNST